MPNLQFRGVEKTELALVAGYTQKWFTCARKQLLTHGNYVELNYSRVIL